MKAREELWVSTSYPLHKSPHYLTQRTSGVSLICVITPFSSAVRFLVQRKPLIVAKYACTAFESGFVYISGSSDKPFNTATVTITIIIVTFT